MLMDDRQQQLDDLYWELGKAYYEGGFEEPLPELLPLFDQITYLLSGQVPPSDSFIPADDYEIDDYDVDGYDAEDYDVDVFEDRIIAQESETAEPRFCAECGHKLRASAVFCSGCGHALA